VSQPRCLEEGRDRWIVRACRLFTAFASNSPDDVRPWDVWVLLSQHAEILIEHTKRWGGDAVPVALAGNQFGLFLQGRRQYAKAEPCASGRWPSGKSRWAPGAPRHASSLENYALLLRNTGRLEEAAAMESRAIAIRAKPKKGNLVPPFGWTPFRRGTCGSC
jgi:hypothetical protein